MVLGKYEYFTLSQVVLMVWNFLLCPLVVLPGLLSWDGGIATDWFAILNSMVRRCCFLLCSSCCHPSFFSRAVGLTSCCLQDLLNTSLAALLFTLSRMLMSSLVWGSYPVLLYSSRYVTISLAQSYKSCTWLTTRFGLHEVHRPQEKNRENYVFRHILKYYVWLEREQNWLSNGLFLFVAKLLSSK